MQSPLRSPLLHFVLIGFALQLGVDLASEERGATGAGEANRFALAAPSGVDIEEEVLHREALRRGLDRLPVVRHRLVQLARTLELADAGASASELESAARALALERSDIIARRYMIASLSEQLRGAVAVEAPDEVEVVRRYDKSLDRFRTPRRVRVRHVYVGGHDGASRVRIDALRTAALASAVDPASLIARGDAFIGGHDLPLWTHARIEGALGRDVADLALSLGVRSWSPVVESPYGFHLLWVDEEAPAEVASLESVRARLVAEIVAQRRDAALAEAIRALVRQTVRVARLDPSPPMG